MIRWLLNRLAPKANAVRRFEGAGAGRRFSGLLSFGNPTSATLAANPTLRGRQRTLAANNAWLANGVAALKAAAVGTGIKPQSTHPDQAVRKKLQAIWNAWVDRADVEGRSDFNGFTSRVYGTFIVDGESFVRLETVNRDLRLRHIPAEQVDAGYTSDVQGGRIIGGVEFDTNGLRTAYHVFRDAPGSPFPWSTALERTRVPAADMLHLFDQMWPGQVRGVSPLSTILLRLHELDQLEDAQLLRVKLGAMLAGFIRGGDESGGAAGLSGTTTNGLLETGLEPGTLKVLPSGSEISFSDPVEPGNVTDWIKLQLRAIAAGMGVTYEQLTGDLSGVNYSSIRAGLVEFRRRIEALQHNVLVFQFCQPVWRRLMLLAMIRGDLPDDGKPETLDAYCAVNWIPPGWDWVDPENDVYADAQAIASGLKSRREVVAARGYDIEQLDAEIAADRQRQQQLGLDFSQPIAKPAKPNASKEAPQNA